MDRGFKSTTWNLLPNLRRRNIGAVPTYRRGHAFACPHQPCWWLMMGQPKPDLDSAQSI
jgi:hypothetical protein